MCAIRLSVTGGMGSRSIQNAVTSFRFWSRISMQRLDGRCFCLGLCIFDKWFTFSVQVFRCLSLAFQIYQLIVNFFKAMNCLFVYILKEFLDHLLKWEFANEFHHWVVCETLFILLFFSEVLIFSLSIRPNNNE